VQVLAPEPIRELQIVRNGEDERSVPIGRNTVDHRWEATREVPGEFWYCRVLFENGEIAWSSPIWLVE